jgi:hypothetical protein
MVSFDPHDSTIPQLLKDRIASWATDIPRLQYYQYGPINKYLNLKFPDQMVKPQGLIRPAMSQDAVEVAVGDDLEQDGLCDVGDTSLISIDSTGTFHLM